jgi:hypothetical protein
LQQLIRCTTATRSGGNAHSRLADVRTQCRCYCAVCGVDTGNDRGNRSLGGSAYRIEVPKTNWNGMLVMYAHGYVGTVSALSITTPSTLRRYLLDNGYAWAASSYSKNWYDARVGDSELFDYFGGLQLAAQKLAGFAATVFPDPNFALISTNVQNTLFTTFPTVPTALGNTYKGVMMNLSGGKRPMFDQGFAGPYHAIVWGTYGGDGTLNGILNKQGVDTNAFVYQFDDSSTLTAEEYAFNVSIVRATAASDFNRLRRDGLRWIPKANGNFSVPVVTIHTLGDLYVPFKMEQIYRTRANAGKGKDWLVQRAIRGVAHCDFTVAETVAAMKAMLDWEQKGIKPTGDDVLTAATVGASSYGCQFTNNTTGVDDSATTAPVRASLPACP